MKKRLPLLLLTISLISLVSLHGYAHLKFIHLDKLNATGQYNKEINFLSDNLSYYENWVPDWNFPVKKDSLIRELKRCYALFASAPAENTETALLLGEISHYLYNMDAQGYYDRAVSAYQKAIHLSEKDYRGYWFLASHYGASAVPDQSAIFFQKAEKLLPSDVPLDFWAEYSYGMLMANMISHCSMALDNAKKISGGSEYEDQIGKLLQLRWQLSDPDSSYTDRDLWRSSRMGKQTAFTSRALGLKIKIDTGWQVRIQDYNGRQTAMILKPKTAMSKKGVRIGYTIAILMKAAAPEENIQAYIENITKGVGKVTPDTLPVLYKDMVSYTIRDDQMYTDRGGGRFHVIGIERTEPAYPGLLLEEPQPLPKGGNGEMNVYSPGQQRKRFPGRIFYVLLLDTCADIHDPSFDIFRRLVRDQLVIE